MKAGSSRPASSGGRSGMTPAPAPPWRLDCFASCCSVSAICAASGDPLAAPRAPSLPPLPPRRSAAQTQAPQSRLLSDLRLHCACCAAGCTRGVGGRWLPRTQSPTELPARALVRTLGELCHELGQALAELWPLHGRDVWRHRSPSWLSWPAAVAACCCACSCDRRWLCSAAHCRRLSACSTRMPDCVQQHLFAGV